MVEHRERGDPPVSLKKSGASKFEALVLGRGMARDNVSYKKGGGEE